MLHYTIHHKELEFKKPAITSRNVFASRSFKLIEFKDPLSGRTGVGEATPLALLSIDDRPEHEAKLEESCRLISEGHVLEDLALEDFPSIAFGIECALLDFNAPHAAVFDTSYTQGRSSIPINGLVWMDTPENMFKAAVQKIDEGFRCIKFKVGAQDFDAECRMLELLRKHYSAFKLEIRLDANGAFRSDEATQQIADLQRFDIHSIEQPLAPGQWDTMAALCRENRIAIALDEELIGFQINQAPEMLKTIAPQYIILKPNLIGGLGKSDRWIQHAQQLDIGWWATSALESNIGLNFIAQWVSKYTLKRPQGLGTGGLYTSNFQAPISRKGDRIHFNPELTTNVNFL
jgi:o-succinylbenzoate synthase